MATFREKKQAPKLQTLYGIIERVRRISYGEGLDFQRVLVGEREYETHAQAAVEPGDFITFNLVPDLFYYPEQPEIPFIRVLSFTNRLYNA